MANLKGQAFNDLLNECRRQPTASGVGLSASLRERLERFTSEQRKKIVSNTRDRSAPLFLTCERGHVEIAKYLIEVCGADIEQIGRYERNRSVHFGTPLWCAAAEGKLSVVKCLIEHGANVNRRSNSGSTPVRSACFMTHYDTVVYLVAHGADIMKPNYEGVTCLMNSVQYLPLCEHLIANGAKVDTQDYRDMTALHYAIQENCFKVAKLLLGKGADPFIKDMDGNDALQTACLYIVPEVANYLQMYYPYSKERVAEAHELIGANFISKRTDIDRALFHWRKALEKRYGNPSKRLEKKCLPRKKPYLNAIEFTTAAELEKLVNDLDAEKPDLDPLCIQSLLVCERILGPLHKYVFNRLIHHSAFCAYFHQHSRRIELWRYALDLGLQKHGLLHTDVHGVTKALTEFFLELHSKNDFENLQFDDVFNCIQLLVNHFEESASILQARPQFKQQLENYDNILRAVSHLFYILSTIPKSSQEVENMKGLIRNVVELDPRTSTGESLLHLVSSRSNTYKEGSYSIFPEPGIIKLLLECGAVDADVDDNLSALMNVNLN